MTEENKPVTAKEFFSEFPEAPVSDTFKWLDVDGYEHMLTIRGYAVSAVLKAIGETRAAIKEQGGTVPAANMRPSNKVQERDETGTPVVDGNGKPVMTNLPEGTGLYNVKQLFHGKTQSGKDFLGVVTIEKPHNRKWGVKCFHPDASIKEWKSWPVSDTEPIYYAPGETAKRVVIREAKGEGTYPEVIEFRTGESPF
jgi:hypothetical protein